MTATAWRAFFAVAAAFNFAVGIPLLLIPATMLGLLNLPMPEDLLFHQVSGLLVACFGVSYAFAARDPERNRDIVWTGVIGKASVVALLGQGWLQGSVPFSLFALSMGDLAFAAGFLVFLLGRRNAA
jgi:hypothetical protein